jgi:hypothetical protein
VGDYLYSWVHQYHPNGQFWRYNGAGWSPFGRQIEDFAGVIVGALSHYTAIYRNAGRRILAVGSADPAVATGARRIYMDLPVYSDTPEYDRDYFDPGPLYYISPWVDMGFLELDGALFWLKIDAMHLSADENVEVWYGLDHDETTWVQLRGSTGAAGIFNGTVDTLYFKTSTPVIQGVKFRSVRLKIILNRKAANTQHTPEVKGFVLCYDKKPECRTAWGVRLDINGMLERPAAYPIAGANFTVAGLWAQLKTWWDTKPLLTLTVPSVTGAMYVRIAAMPITLEDFRTSIAGKGFVDLQCVETINA